MANYFILTLDTTAPANPSVKLNSGSLYATQHLINLTIGTDDTDTAGYQMKIWGDVDPEDNVDIQTSEASSSWITYATNYQVKLAEQDGNKTIHIKVRDNVHNASAMVSSSILLDTEKPVVTVTEPDVSVISKIDGKNIASFSFSCAKAFTEYKVKVVSSEGAAHDSGVIIGTSRGSTNMAGTGIFEEDTPINCQITGGDLEEAASGDGGKIIKVFVKDEADQWNV